MERQKDIIAECYINKEHDALTVHATESHFLFLIVALMKYLSTLLSACGQLTDVQTISSVCAMPLQKRIY